MSGAAVQTVTYSAPRVAAGALTSLGLASLSYAMGRRRSKRLVDPLSTCPEGLIPGNPLIDGGRVPKGQVAIALKKDGKLHIVGGGFRMNNHLITPTHNCQFGYELWIVQGDLEAKVDVETEIILAADVSAFAVPESTWTRLRVPQVKLGPIKQTSTVSITSSCDNKYSVSTLTATKPLGRVQYNGSTIPGFSGSLYMNGTVAVAMHCHGGHRGGGYETLYLYARLNHALKLKPEDSHEFWMKQAEAGATYEYEELAEKEYVMRFTDGTYHLATEEIIEKMENLRGSSRWDEEIEYDELAEELSRRIPECKQPELVSTNFSGEGQRPELKGQQAPTPAPSQSLQDSALSLVVQELRRVKEDLSMLLKEANSTKRPKGSLKKDFQEDRLNTVEELLAKLQQQLTTTGQQIRRRRRNSTASAPSSQKQQSSGAKPRSQQMTKNKSC